MDREAMQENFRFDPNEMITAEEFVRRMEGLKTQTTDQEILDYLNCGIS